jgi:hypothetical protein
MSAGHWDAEQTSRAMRIEEIGGSDCRQTHERERKPAGLKSSGRPGSMENLDTRAAHSAEGGDHRSEAPSVGRGNPSRLHHRFPVGRSLGGCPWEQTRPERAPEETSSALNTQTRRRVGLSENPRPDLTERRSTKEWQTEMRKSQALTRR